MIKNFTLVGGLLLSTWASALAQKSVHCPDGDHLLIDVKQIAIQYDASSFAGTLSSLSVLSEHLEIAPTKLQEAAVATQQWNEFIKGLAEGFNNCAVTRQQYADGLNRIYPRLKQDAAGLDAIRKLIAEGQKADTKRLQTLLDSFWGNLQQFAQAGGKQIILERIEALSEQVAASRANILAQQKTDTDRILQRLNELQQNNKQAPLPTPEDINVEIRKSLQKKAEEAEASYSNGYQLANRYRFQEAIPYLQQAIKAVPLPEFYLALGRAFAGIPDLKQAEKTFRDGLELTSKENDSRTESCMANQLAFILLDKGDLDGALSSSQRARQTDENVFGPDDPSVATDYNSIGLVLRQKGDLEGALRYTRQALEINERAYGSQNQAVAINALNMGQILQAKGDLDEALRYLKRALEIDEMCCEPDHPWTSTEALDIGQILAAKGELDGALRYMNRALEIDTRHYGPDHPYVAADALGIGGILQARGNLEGAIRYAMRALRIDERARARITHR